jgi:hypothetical protein
MLLVIDDIIINSKKKENPCDILISVSANLFVYFTSFCYSYVTICVIYAMCNSVSLLVTARKLALSWTRCLLLVKPDSDFRKQGSTCGYRCH